MSEKKSLVLRSRLTFGQFVLLKHTLEHESITVSALLDYGKSRIPEPFNGDMDLHHERVQARIHRLLKSGLLVDLNDPGCQSHEAEIVEVTPKGERVMQNGHQHKW